MNLQLLTLSESWQDFVNSFARCFIHQDRWELILRGLGNTLLIALVATLIGVAIGALVAIARVFSASSLENPLANKFSKTLARIVNAITGIYITVIRGTPMLVQLLIMYYVVFASADSGVPVAMLSFGINSGAYVAETIRGGINSVDRGQMEAGRSLGLSRVQTMRSIILPQAIKNILPALGNEFITLLKETSIVGYIAINDLTRAGDRIRSATFEMFLPLIVVALIYLVLVLGLSRLLKVFERRLAKSDSR